MKILMHSRYISLIVHLASETNLQVLECIFFDFIYAIEMEC